MKTLKKMLKPILPADAAEERFSFRVQDGVEIYEHEYVRSLRMSDATAPAHRPEPRLVVEESAERVSVILAKDRSDIGGLIRLLKSATVSG